MQAFGLARRMRGYYKEFTNRVAQNIRLRDVEKKEPILIYQMGKVGSSTIAHTLEQLQLDSPILHIHTLSESHLNHAIQRQRSTSSRYLHKHLLVSSILVDKLKQGVFPCKVITVTREPVSHAISFVFEDMKKQAPEAIVGDQKVDVDVIKRTLDKLFSEKNGVSNPGIWFDNELKECLGIDVFSVPYDHEQGFSIIEGDNISVLVIRMEDINKALMPALSTFLEMELSHISMKRANIGSKKWYANDIKLVKDTYRMKNEFAAALFETQYFEHFYPTEKSSLMEAWT